MSLSLKISKEVLQWNQTIFYCDREMPTIARLWVEGAIASTESGQAQTGKNRRSLSDTAWAQPTEPKETPAATCQHINQKRFLPLN